MNKKLDKEIVDTSYIVQDDKQGNPGPHSLVTKTIKGKAPDMFAVGCIKLDPQVRSSWIGYTVRFNGKEIKELTITECDLKPIIEGFVKVNVQQKLFDEDTV